MAFRIAWYRTDMGGQDKDLWEDLWKTTGLAESIPDMRYFAEYPFCLKYLAPEGGAILDAGCGGGHYTVSLSERGFNMYGLDFCRETLNQLKTLRPMLKLQIGDVRSLPYDKNVFGGVLHFGVAEHFKEGPRGCIEESYRVLKPGGYLLLSVPYMNLLRKMYYPYYVINSKTKRYDKRMFFYQYIFTKYEIGKILKESGFELVEWRRQYYTTVVNKYDTLNSLRKYIVGIFKEREKPDVDIRDGNINDNPKVLSNHGVRPSECKAVVKNIMESGLNSVMAHFVLFVAKKI